MNPLIARLNFVSPGPDDVRKARNKGQSLSAANLEGIDLSQMDLTSADLGGQSFWGAI